MYILGWLREKTHAAHVHVSFYIVSQIMMQDLAMFLLGTVSHQLLHRKTALFSVHV